jgi:hypothetical protein
MNVPTSICMINGQGGGISATLIKDLKAALGESVELLALGTNAVATVQMLRAGANRGASGENAVCQSVARADVIWWTARSFARRLRRPRREDLGPHAGGE